jgi:hypothetical protein
MRVHQVGRRNRPAHRSQQARHARTRRVCAQLAGVACCVTMLSAAAPSRGPHVAVVKSISALPGSTASPAPSGSTSSTAGRTQPRLNAAKSHRLSVPAATAVPERRAPTSHSLPSLLPSPSSGQPATAPPAGRPGPANTGVPAGTALTARYGDMHVTTPGVTLDALDIHGFVFIEAPNVTIKRSIIRGGRATSGNPGLITAISANGTNFQLADSELAPAYPSVYLDGVKGGNFTLTRVDVHSTVDGVKVFGSNVTIQQSWLHDTIHYASDPNQGGGPSHNDGVQVLGGTSIRIVNNTITGATNAALQVTQGQGRVSGLAFGGNWADGGVCTVNIANIPLPSISGIDVSNNRFGRASQVSNCPIILAVHSQVSISGNVWDDTGKALGARYS